MTENRNEREVQLDQELLEFIEKSPTAFHACRCLKELLEKSGAEELLESRPYLLEKGKTYFVMRNGTSLISFRIPKEEAAGFHLIASHSDSPCFKLKEHAEMEADGHYTLLNVEKYGGMLMAPWFDRPLSIAGRVVVKSGNRIESRLIDFGEDLVMIPNLAIHMNREANDGYKYNAQKDMMPILGDETAKDQWKERIADKAGCRAEEILGTDLFLYNRQRGTLWGANREFLSAPRLDDLQCAFGSMNGFLEAKEGKSVAVCAVFDNEETGSLSKQGASSTFLRDTLCRIAKGLSWTEEKYLMALQNSFMISADNAHAAHPNHLDRSDATNRPYMNHGIVMKFNAAQKYTTDGVSAALLRMFCEKAGVALQVFANRSDMPGGSTLGNLSNAQVSLNTVDIGLPQLAMHSPYETAGSRDLADLVQLAEVFYSSSIQMSTSGSYEIME